MKLEHGVVALDNEAKNNKPKHYHNLNTSLIDIYIAGRCTLRNIIISRKGETIHELHC